jgi:hypothetical protein
MGACINVWPIHADLSGLCRQVSRRNGANGSGIHEAYPWVGDASHGSELALGRTRPR